MKDESGFSSFIPHPSSFQGCCMPALGKLLMVVGLVLLALGGLLVWGGTGSWASKIGRLPGDIYIRRGNFTFYFPLMTSILLSLLLTFLLYLFRSK